MRVFLSALLILLLGVLAAPAQEARIMPGQSLVTLEGRDRGRPRPVVMVLRLTHAVPYRVFLVDGPPRLVIDAQGLQVEAQDLAQIADVDALPALRSGHYRRGWSRLIVELGATYRIETAAMRAGAEPLLSIRLTPVAPEDFAPRGAALSALRDLPEPSLPAAVLPERGPLHVAIDPGHGGHDPGAQSEGVTEAQLMLNFAMELASTLRAQGVEVTLTRNGNVFVPLERRMTIARQAGADLLLSLHADALPQGAAAGATIYVWNPESNDRAAQDLAARHGRDDLLGGVDLAGADDEVASVLMDIARADTQPRSENAAKFLASQIAQRGLGLHRGAIKGASFSVLKSPDIPSVLLELGFLTDAEDRRRLLDPEWRTNMAGAVASALIGWDSDERLRAGQLRR